MFPFFNHYPGTDLHEIDLAYVLKLCAELRASNTTLTEWKAQHELEYLTLENQVEGLIHNLVDVIVPWDSSIEYHIYSIVEYQGTNYIAVQDVPVGVMITNTAYWQPANNVIAQINAIGTTVSDLQRSKFYVTPEDYGAAGDGVTDDTAAFAAAIASGNDVQCFGDKTYIVNELDITDTVHLYGNGATLKASVTCDYVIKLDSSTNIYHGIVDGFVIDGNFLATACIDLRMFRVVISNCYLNSPALTGYGIYAANGNTGGARLYSLFGNGGDKQNTATMLYIHSADINASMIDYQNYKYGLDLAANFQIQQFHGYIIDMDAEGLFDDSAFMILRSGRLNAFNVYPDTQQTWFNVDGIGDYRIDGGAGYHNTGNGVPDANVANTTLGKVYVVTGLSAAVRRMHLLNFDIHTGTALTNILFSNYNSIFDTSGTGQYIDSKCNYNTWIAASNKTYTSFMTISGTGFTSHLSANMLDNILAISGYVTFDNTPTTGTNSIEIATLTGNAEPFIMSNTSLFDALVGTDLYGAQSNTYAKWGFDYTNNKIMIRKTSALDLAEKNVYISGFIPVRIIN